MNSLSILDSISDRSKIYFLPINSKNTISYENSLLTFHIISLYGSKINDIPGKYDRNGVYFEPVDLVGLSAGVAYGLYLEIRNGNSREYYPGQSILYIILSNDAKVSILHDIPADYFNNQPSQSSGKVPFDSVKVQTLDSDSEAYSMIDGNTLILGIPQGKQGPQGKPGINGERGPQGPRGYDGLNGKNGISYIPYINSDGEWHIKETDEGNQ